MSISRDEGNVKISEARRVLMEIYDLMPSNPNERGLISRINSSLYQLESLIKNQKCEEVF